MKGVKGLMKTVDDLSVFQTFLILGSDLRCSLFTFRKVKKEGKKRHHEGICTGSNKRTCFT